MKLYWPCGVYLDDWKEEQTLFTCDSCLTLDKAFKQIRLWRDWYRYNITRAWVDVYDSDNDARNRVYVPLGLYVKNNKI